MTTLLNRLPAATSVARDNSYAHLYQAVINRALQDLLQKQLRDEARQWLFSSESDYAFATAGISRHSIRQQMI
jgi:hypothetical protein